MTEKNIPQSVLIADTKSKLDSLVNHPILSPTILETIFKEAYLRVSLRAQEEVSKDYEDYKKSQAEASEKEEEQ